MQYVSLPANFLASVQPLSDESGLIYYRELIASMDRGNVAKDQVIGKQGGKLSDDLDTYYTEELTWTGTTNSDTVIDLEAPIRPRIMKFSVTIVGGGNAGTYHGLDDGEGSIIANWPTEDNKACGIVDYTHATVNVTCNVDHDGGVATMTIVYHQNLAQSDEIPGFIYRLTSKSVRANYYILQSQYSSLSEYAVRRRFGAAMADDIVSSAVTQINAAVLSSMIRKLKAAATLTGTVNWQGTAPAGVALAHHRQTFTDAIEAGAQLIDAETGRGAISFIVAGSYTRRILSTLGVEMTRKPLPGPYLCGFFQNVPVFYAPQNLVANDECIIGYRGTSWFEAPLVYAPWLPVVVVKGQGQNVFNRVSGIAHSAGVETLITGFTAMIKIV